MRRLMLTLGALLWASITSAQVVQVRSGQHDDFTRLIVELPKRLDVQIKNDDGAATIRFPNQDLTFDTTPVFRRISRDRIADVSSDADRQTLRVEFGCNCEVSSFWHDKSLLVLDVRERSDEERQTADVDEPPVAHTPDPVRLRLRLPQETRSLAASLANSQLNQEADDDAPLVKPISQPENSGDVSSAAVISEARERLVKQIGRAASQGLLSPRTILKPGADSHLATAEPGADTRIEETPLHPVATDPSAHVNLQAQSSIDRDFMAMMARGVGATGNPVCLEPRLVDVAQWGADKPFSVQIGNLRMSLMGEFDELNQEAALQLTRLYLFFGFGAEARLAIELAEERSEEVGILQSLAAVMEKGYAPVGSPLQPQLDCEGPVSLWSVLSHQKLPQNSSIEIDAVLRTFDALPRHLRSHLGPILSRRLLDAGHQDAADKVLRILNRHEETQSAGAQLVEAEMDITEGAETQGSDTMEDIIATNSEPSADALITLISAKIRSGQSVSYDHAILAGAYAQQNRGGENEKDLIRAYLTGLSASRAYDQSYEEYARLGPDLAPAAQQEVMSEMLHQLTSSADEITFIRHVLAHHSDGQPDLAPEIANAAAERLLEIGFASQARLFVIGDASGDAGRDRQFLRARISLAEGRPHQAGADLEGLSGDAADLLRAQARSVAGDHRAAADLFSSSGHEQQSLRQSWLAEDWTRLMDSQDAVLSDVAALVVSREERVLNSDDGNGEPQVERVLARNRGLIQQSSTTRDMIGTIMQANPAPDGGLR